MESRKAKSANLESQRKSHLLLGLTIACALSLAAFEWRTAEKEMSLLGEMWEGESITTEEDVSAAIVVYKPMVVQISKEKFKIVEDHTPIEQAEATEDDEAEFDENWTAGDFMGEEIEDAIVVSRPKGRMPEYPGGDAALLRFLGDELIYPEIARSIGDEGTVYVSFVVNKEGLVSDVQVVRGISPSLDKEAIRVVKRMPAWEPGIYQGLPADFKYTLPVKFSLD